MAWCCVVSVGARECAILIGWDLTLPKGTGMFTLSEITCLVAAILCWLSSTV